MNLDMALIEDANQLPELLRRLRSTVSTSPVAASAPGAGKLANARSELEAVLRPCLTLVVESWSHPTPDLETFIATLGQPSGSGSEAH